MLKFLNSTLVLANISQTGVYGVFVGDSFQQRINTLFGVSQYFQHQDSIFVSDSNKLEWIRSPNATVMTDVFFKQQWRSGCLTLAT